jgi:Protein kinase domain
METPLEVSDPGEIGGYKLDCRLGAGGMGVVYKGTSPTGLTVAVKMVKSHLLADAAYRERFRREVLAVQAVPRHATAQILHADVDAEPPYLVTEYIVGPTLDEEVRNRGRLPEADVEALAVATAGALDVIHAAGVIHRDLSPRNILLSSCGPRVIDFGLATLVELNEQLSRSGPIGTFAFMAPERLRGIRVNAAADVYSWGAVVTFAATGEIPQEVGYPLDTWIHHLDGTSAISGPLRSIVKSALATSPQVRPTASQVVGELRKALSTSSRVLESVTDRARPPMTAEQWAAEAQELIANKARVALYYADQGLLLDPLCAQCLLARGLALAAMGDRTAAADTLMLAYQMDSTDEVIAQGYALFLSEEPAHLREAYRIAPEDDTVRRRLLKLLVDEGVSGIREAYRIAPNDKAVRQAYLQLLFAQGSSGIREAFSIAPTDKAVRQRYSHLLLSLGPEEVAEAYRILPEDDTVREKFVQLLLEQGPEGVQQAYDISPEDATVRGRYIDMLVQQGYWGVSKARNIASGDNYLTQRLVSTLLANGKYDAVLQAFDIAPHYQPAQRAAMQLLIWANGSEGAKKAYRIAVEIPGARESLLKVLRDSRNDQIQCVFNSVDDDAMRTEILAILLNRGPAGIQIAYKLAPNNDAVLSQYKRMLHARPTRQNPARAAISDNRHVAPLKADAQPGTRLGLNPRLQQQFVDAIFVPIYGVMTSLSSLGGSGLSVLLFGGVVVLLGGALWFVSGSD